MAKKKLRMLITDDRPDVTDALKKMLSQYDVTTVADSHAAALLGAQEEYDLIITEYAVPPVSGIEGITVGKPSEGRSTREKASVLRELRKILQDAEEAAKDKEARAEQMMTESRARQAKILEDLNDHVRRMDTERVELGLEARKLQGELKTALEQKAALERDLAAVRSEMANQVALLQQKVNSLQAELKDAVAGTEALRGEKAQTEGNLQQTRKEAADAAADFTRKIDSLLRDQEKANAVIQSLQQEKAEAEGRIIRLEEEYTRSLEEFRRQSESLTAELQKARSDAEAIQRERSRVEREMAQVQSEMEEEIVRLKKDAKAADELRARMKSLNDELSQVQIIADTALAEKGKMEEKLLKLQKNWEKYVAGS